MTGSIGARDRTDGAAPPDPVPSTRILVIAKAPVAGRSKTRLMPPCTPGEAAALAEAALVDTLDAVTHTPARERVLVLDGVPGPWLPDGFRVIPQRAGSLDERIAAAFEDVGGPALLIGMDTPQVTPALLTGALGAMDDPDVDAVLGEAADGGWWAMGLRSPDARTVVGLPMSTGRTADAQRNRLRSLGLRVRELPVLRDVDGIDDAVAVAAGLPGSRFARAVRQMRAAPFRTAGAAAGVLAAVAILLVLANRVADRLRLEGFRMKLYAPPLVGKFDLRPSPRIAWALAVGAAVAWFGPRAAARLRWRHLLWASFTAAALWAVALALHQGIGGITQPPSAGAEYLRDLGRVGSPGAFLAGFVDRIDLYATHVRAHPPGYLLALWLLNRAGAAGPGWVGTLQLTAGAAAVPAVLLAAREVAGEHAARLAAPFVVLMPAALFFGSGDAVFLGVGAWAVALLVLATGRRDRRGDLQAAGAGLLFGLGLFLSYGLVVLAAVPLTVAVARRRVRPLLVASVPILLVTAGFAAAGFWWVAGLRATRLQYLASVARVRPAWYFVWGNLAAFAVAIGPAIWVGLLRLRDRRLWLLTGGAAVAVALADLSLLSKGEVERIWLPFAPWFLLAGAALGARRQRQGWLAAQAVAAVAIQMWVISPW
ncbi:MAG: DUF2064 domain-containing protein [Actinomycetota bacterium]